MKKAITILIIFTLSTGNSYSQAGLEEKVKAVFLFHFIHFVQWPPAAQNQSFTITTIGGNPFGNYLEEAIRGEYVYGRPITVKHIKTIEELGHTHILYINQSLEKHTEDIIKFLAGRPILTVSDIPAFYRYGGMIRFYEENFKVRLEINPVAARAASLVISSKLLRAARIRS